MQQGTSVLAQVASGMGLVGKGAADKSTITVEARADLDCDGRFSSYLLKGSVRGGAATFDPMRVTDGLE